jgi:RecA-family ATPase
LKVSDIQNLQDPQWLVSELIPEDSFSVIYGPPGSTKSFLALDLACCIATGLPWKNQSVREGKVMVCVGEGLRGLKWRLESWMLAHPEADPEMLEQNLQIIEDVPHLLEKADTAMLLNTAVEMHEESDADLKLFVIDTLARALVGGDENSAQDVGRAIDACEKVRKATGATALVVHHSGVEGTRERGSTALRGAADTSIQVAHDEVNRVTTVAVKKIKDGEGGKNYKLALAKYGHSVVLSNTVVNMDGHLPSGVPFRSEKSRADWAREALAAKESPF